MDASNKQKSKITSKTTHKNKILPSQIIIKLKINFKHAVAVPRINLSIGHNTITGITTRVAKSV